MKTRNQDYYASLARRMGDNILSTDEVYQLIEETDAEFGFKTPKSLRSVYVEKFCSLLGDLIAVVIDTEKKRRGRGGCSKVYQINDLNLAISRINSLEMATKAKVEKEVKVMEVKVKKAPTPAKQVGSKKLDTKTIFEQLYQQLNVAYDSRDYTISLTPTRMKCLIENHIETILIADWSKKRRNIINFYRQSDLKTSMIALDSYMKEKFNLDMGACMKFNIVKVSERRQLELAPEDEDLILYVMGKLICSEKRPIDLSVILKTLREHFGIFLDRQSLLNLTKSEELLLVSQDKSSVSLKTGADPDAMFQKHSPENHKEVIYARIGMAQKEVCEYFADAELVSKISENDGIYALSIDRSFKTRAKLLKLYRTFRGTDMIIGRKDIVDYLNLQIVKADGLYKNDSFLYRLETTE